MVGRVINGYDYVNNDNDANDDNGHGTQMSGIIAATMNNSLGVTRVSQSKMLAVKVCNNHCNTTADLVGQGIDYAVSHNAKIISMSFTLDAYSDYLKQRIDHAYASGCLLVAATGNQGKDVVQYPAAYNHVIAVGAIDQNNARCQFSNYGPEIDLVAPGISVGTTFIGSTHDTQYGSISGTSPATAFISGVAALAWSQNPSLPNNKIWEYLINSATDLGPNGFDNEYGYGRVNAYGATLWANMIAAGSSSLPGSNYEIGLQLYIPVESYVTTVMCGNENSDFDMLAKWNAQPTPTDYDVASQSDSCLEGILTKGSGNLYLVVYSYNGSGNFKIWSLSGGPSSSQVSRGSLPGPGYAGISSYSGGGQGYVFNSGPDGSNFDLYIKWNAQPTPTDYDSIGNSPESQEYAGPALNNGTLCSAVFANSGSGEFWTISAIY